MDIDKRLLDLEQDLARQLLLDADDKHRANKTWCVGVRWDLFEKQDLLEIVEVSTTAPREVSVTIVLFVFQVFRGEVSRWHLSTCL